MRFLNAFNSERLTRRFNVLGQAFMAVFTNRWLNQIMFWGVLAYLVFFISDRTSAKDFENIRLDGLWTAVSVAATFVYLTVYAWIWHYLTQLMGIDFLFGRTLAIWSFSNLGKYLPFKVAKYGYRIGLYTKEKPDSAKRVIKGSYVETFASILGGLLVFVALLPLQTAQYSFLDLPTVLAVCLCVLGLLLITSSRRFDEFIERTFGISLLARYIRKRTQIKIIALYIIAWVIAGLAFYATIKAVAPDSTSVSLTEAIFVFAVGGVIGIISVFAPSGIGVREGVLLIILGRDFPVAEATAIVILSRVILVICEFIAITYGFIRIQVEKGNAES